MMPTALLAVAEVLVVGTFHMANPGHDMFNMQADDVLAEKRQKEIAQVIDVRGRRHLARPSRASRWKRRPFRHFRASM